MLSNLLGWAHRIIHLRWRGPPIPLIHSLLDRSSDWWRSIQPLVTISNDRSRSFSTRWRHRRTGPPSRGWDTLLSETLGEQWYSILSNMSPPTQAQKLRFASQALYRLGFGSNSIEVFPSAVPDTRTQHDKAKSWETLVQDAQIDIPQTLARTRSISMFWSLGLHNWPRDHSIEILSDNSGIVSWLNGRSYPMLSDGKQLFNEMWDRLDRLLSLGIKPRNPDIPIASWVPRSLTSASDLLCNICMDLGQSLYWVASDFTDVGQHFHLRCIGDGANRESSGKSAFSTIILSHSPVGGYRVIGVVGVFFNFSQPVFLMEAKATLTALQFVEWMIQFPNSGPCPFQVLAVDTLPRIIGNLVLRALRPWL